MTNSLHLNLTDFIANPTKLCRMRYDYRGLSGFGGAKANCMAFGGQADSAWKDDSNLCTPLPTLSCFVVPGNRTCPVQFGGISISISKIVSSTTLQSQRMMPYGLACLIDAWVMLPPGLGCMRICRQPGLWGDMPPMTRCIHAATLPSA